MEQSNLRAWEYKCIQEEPPFCQAACPLHVDIRAMLGHVAAGRMNEARKVLDRTMPLSGVFGLICDHPCEIPCRRGDVEEVIRIGELERAVVLHGRAVTRVLPQPSKGKSLAVLGGGPSSLVAAWDLARKGYAATVLYAEEEPGGLLLTLPEERLPRQALREGVQAMERLGVAFRRVPRIDAALLDAAAAEHDAVYVGFDVPAPPSPEDVGLSFEAEGPSLDPLTLATTHPGVFAGGFPRRVGVFEPIFLAMDGRRAASSIDRLLQQVSLTASREKEGPFPTRLFTSIYGVEPQACVPAADPSGRSVEEARTEAGRCLQCECMECVKVCEYLAHYKGYPKRYAREIYNNLSVVQGMRLSNRMILSCSHCGLCETVCPNDFHVGELCFEARAEMVRTSKMPPSAHDFALHDLAFNTSPEAALRRHAPGSEKSEWCFFPGCQLGGSSPEHVLRTYAHLRGKLGGDVGVMLFCCGAPAEWAAREDLARQAIDTLRSWWEELGSPRMILGCTTCMERFARVLPEMECVSLWEMLDKTGLPAGARAGKEPLWLHDPCTSRHAPESQAAVRRILASLGQEFTAPRLAGELTECCGYGGHMEAAHPALGAKVATVRADRLDGSVLAWCAMCRDSLSRGGKTVYHLLDLIFPDSPDASQPVSPSPLIRKGRGQPSRQENRMLLRRRLGAGAPGEPAAAPAPHEAVRLVIGPQAREVLDERRILDDDIRRVLVVAGTMRHSFHNPKTGRFLAGRRLHHATYWVEYTPLPDEPLGFEVHRAWSHRMSIEGVC